MTVEAALWSDRAPRNPGKIAARAEMPTNFGIRHAQASDGRIVAIPESVVSITDTSVARRKRHAPSLTVGSTQCLREYSRLALCGLLRFSRAPSQQGVHNSVRSTAFNPFEYRHGSARWRVGE